MPDWNARFMALAEHVSTWSKDRSTKVGSVIVGPEREIVSVGYNGFARGVSDAHPERHERPLKYLITNHSEANAVLNAHRVGARVMGCDLYVTAFPPCANCSNIIVQAGIRRVFCYREPEREDTLERWKHEILWGEVIRREGGVETVYLERH